MRRGPGDRETDAPASPARRRLLSILGAIATAGCARGGAPPASGLRPGQIALPEPWVRPGRRFVVLLGADPVEIQRTGDRIVARSLMCTHTGCFVRWQPDVQQYVCPCHEGRYSAEGEVVAGPPPQRLREVPVARVRGQVIVG